MHAVDALSIDVLMKFKHTKHSSKAKCVYVRHQFIVLLHDCSTILIQYYNTFAVSFTLMMTIWKHVHDKEHNTTQVQGRVRYSKYAIIMLLWLNI